MIPDKFDARTVPPQQGFDTHPPGMFDFTISHTYLKETKNKDGAMLAVEFTTPAGKIENFYNLFNKSEQAVEIARKQLSALCHAVNIYDVQFPKNPDGSPIMDKAGHSLRGGRGRMEIAPQTDKEGKPNGYMDVKKVFDVHGNEPGKGGSAPQPQQQQWGNGNQQQPQPQPQQQQAPAPMQQQPNGQWGTSQQQPSNPAPQNGPAWGTGQQQPQQQTGGNPTPPWASR